MNTFVKVSVIIVGQYSSSIFRELKKMQFYYLLCDKIPNYHLKHVQSGHELRALPHSEEIKSSANSQIIVSASLFIPLATALQRNVASKWATAQRKNPQRGRCLLKYLFK